MKTMHITKAGDMGDITIHDIRILIDKKMPDTKKFKDLKEVEEFYDKDAEKLAITLLESLPQGVIEPLLVKLMRKNYLLKKAKT